MQPSSPYAWEAKALVRFANMYQLLSDTHCAQGVIIQASPKLHLLCRLGVLFAIHATFIAHRHSVLNLRAELKQLREWLGTNILDPYTTVESLTAIIHNHKELHKAYSPDKAPLVLQMFMVAKRLSFETLTSLVSLFFGYLSGETYSAYERSLYWDVEALGLEARLAEGE